MTSNRPVDERWPPLPLADWQDTQATLHRWTQIVGKVKLALTPFLNEWWNVAFSVTPRGWTTRPIPAGNESFAVDFDFIDHRLLVQISDGRTWAMPLRPQSVADFYAEFLGKLGDFGIAVTIDLLPAEIPDPIPFDVDRAHASYDPEFAHRFWRIVLQTEQVVQRFRSPFVGKSSPVLFFWGSFDLSHTRYSGRPATPPARAPRFVQIAETQENFACGFWPGNANMAGTILGEAAFYAYHYPEPPGFKTAAAHPAAADYNPDLGEFVLRYDDVRRAPSPEQAILEFFQSTYEAAATLAGWDRGALERIPPEGAPR